MDKAKAKAEAEAEAEESARGVENPTPRINQKRERGAPGAGAV
jgi:hypothetical protein